MINLGFGAVSEMLDGIVDSIGSAISEALLTLVGTVCYYITKAVLYIIHILQLLFDVFSGQSKVQYNQEAMYLTDVFFSNQSIRNVYWAMTLLASLFVFFFGMMSVIRKFFDLGDKHQNQTYGTILGTMFRAIFTMVILGYSMNLIILLTNTVVSRINYIFDNADSMHIEQKIEFTPQQFAAMGRIYATIGNYSLNPSYNSRYNLNKCYNEIRSDLSWLGEEGIFDYTYVSVDEAGNTYRTWQSMLEDLYIAATTERDMTMDVYHEQISKELLAIMSVLKTDRSFGALKSYANPATSSNGVGLDRVLFLSGTMEAANNASFNRNPYMTDPARGVFFNGTKSIYDLDEVQEVFNVKIGSGGIDYIMIWLVAYFTIKNLLRCIFNCVVRLFNLVSLYIVAPLTMASMPLDDGEKFKQWTTSMIVQLLGVLGVIIPMRLVILFTPIVLSNKLVLFPDDSILNFIGKIIMIVGAMTAVDGFGKIVEGILANNASMASLGASQAANSLGDRAFSSGTGAAKSLAGAGMNVASTVTGAKFLGRKVGGAVAGGIGRLSSAMTENFGLIGAVAHAFSGGGKSDKSQQAAGGGAGGTGGGGGSAPKNGSATSGGGQSGAMQGLTGGNGSAQPTNNNAAGNGPDNASPITGNDNGGGTPPPPRKL